MRKGAFIREWRLFQILDHARVFNGYVFITEGAFIR